MVEHDNKVYNEDLEWKNSTIEILVRAMVKLSNMEDTTLLEDMRKVQDLVKKVFKNKTCSTPRPGSPHRRSSGCTLGQFTI